MPKARVWSFVTAVGLCGAAALFVAVRALSATVLDPWMLVLGILIVAGGWFSIKVPGHPATVSVSEVFVFTSMLLFGPAPATIVVALDGLWVSCRQQHPRLHRTIFNVAEPALSTLAAGLAFSATAGLPPLGGHAPHLQSYVLPALAMTVTYFFSNSLLQAAAVAIESRQSLIDVWGQHALYLGLNYYAAASLATLGVANASGLNVEIVGLVAPLLLLSYGAYKSAASRMEDADGHIREVEHLYQATVETLAIAVDAKDQVTHGHIRRVQRHTLSMAHAMGLKDPLELKALAAAALLHDVGKLAVPDYVLNKPGALSHAEFDRMKLHAAKGAEILTAVEFPYPVVPVVRHHHEQWNGQGYPDGLAGESIPIGARILTVVDCFDALTSDRPYRRRMTDQEATAILEARSGTMYDPRIVSRFVEMIPTLRREDAIAEGVHVDRRNAEAAGAAHASERAAVPQPPGTSLTLGRTAGVMSQKLVRSMPEAQICLFAPEAGSDYLYVSYATPAVGCVAGALRIRVGEGLAGWIAANRHTIVNSDAGLDLGNAADQLSLRSCAATPVFALGTLVGVLAAYTPEKRGFSADDVRAIAALAEEIGLEIARQDQPTFTQPASAVRYPRAAAVS